MDARIAVIIPCFNEEASIDTVVSDFRKVLSEAAIYVYDNNSTDATVEKAGEAGAIIRTEKRQGKGYVVRRMFADIEADIYILVDGDNTYSADVAKVAVDKLIAEGLDMLNIARKDMSQAAYRTGHRFGNKMLTSIVKIIFSRNIDDLLSGYRVFSKRYVKSFPAYSTGFEIETELTVHALELGMPIGEIFAPYKERPEGSASKLNTIRDGVRILWTILRLMKDEKPLVTFSSVSLVLFLLSFVLGFSITMEFMETGLVPRMPTAILSVGVMILSFLSLIAGVILDTVTRGRKEMKQLFYLRFSRLGE